MYTPIDMSPLFTTIDDLHLHLSSSLSFSPTLSITNKEVFRDRDVDVLIYNAIFASDQAVLDYARSLIYQLSDLSKIQSSSMHAVYKAFGDDQLSGFSTPALNVRTLTYDIARLIFRMLKQRQIGAVVFEISRTEMAYTNQPPAAYATSILAAALKEDYQGPVFLQGDHFQLNKDAFLQNRDQEINAIKNLIKTAIDAKFYNIDIDASTLVELEKTDFLEQQQLNATVTAELSEYIREVSPAETTISIGAEIGHIGDRNSTPEDLTAFMSLYQKAITQEGISKVSIQTGTSHGGTLLPDGTLKKVDLDFSALKTIGDLARSTYHLGGVVQHGASTLPDADFDKFVENQTLEIHLATGLQNIIYDNLPNDITKQLSDWVLAQKPADSPDTDEQFIYKTRKKALGPFEKNIWDLSQEEKNMILKKLEEHFLIIFEKLRLFNTREKILPYFTK